VGGAHAGDEGFFVVVEFGEHVCGGDEFGVVIGDALNAGNVADGADRGAADFANALGDFVGAFEELVGVIVEKQVVVAEVRSGHVPMEIFGFHVDGEDIGEDRVESGGDVFYGFGVDAGVPGERGLLTCDGFGFIGHGMLLFFVGCVGTV